MLILIAVQQDEDSLGPWTLQALAEHRTFPINFEADHASDALRELADRIDEAEHRWESIPD